MKLNHINLVVTNVSNAITFFETHFDFKCTLTKGDNVIAILKGSDSFTLVLMAEKDSSPAYPKNFHIGFLLETMEQVESTYRSLKSSNVTVESEPRRIRDSFGFSFYFENILIEVAQLTE